MKHIITVSTSPNGVLDRQIEAPEEMIRHLQIVVDDDDQRRPHINIESMDTDLIPCYVCKEIVPPPRHRKIKC